jgi:hypothetical protein
MIKALLLLSEEVSSVALALFLRRRCDSIWERRTPVESVVETCLWWEPVPVKEIQTMMLADGSKCSINGVW